MGQLQEQIEEAIRQLAKPTAILTELLRRWFEQREIDVSADELKVIAIAINDAMISEGATNGDSVTLELDVSPGVGAAVNELLAGPIASLIADYEEDLHEAVGKGVEGTIRDTATALFEQVKSNSHETLAHTRSEYIEFEQRLYRRWATGIDMLEVLISVARELGEDFLDERGSKSQESNGSAAGGHRFVDVLFPLHAKACRIASEALVLLKSGFADGAHARWRSLHEVAVTLLFLTEHGVDVQGRYLDHAAVQRYRAAKQYQQHCHTLGFEPISEEELAVLKSQSKSVAERYGPSFNADYGWACKVLNSDRVTFADIERSLKMDQWRPLYKMACHSVHAGAHSLWFALGVPEHRQPILFSGRSNAGLADPGHSVAISLTQACVALLGCSSSADHAMLCQVLIHFVDEIGRALLEAHEQLETEMSDENT